MTLSRINTRFGVKVGNRRTRQSHAAVISPVALALYATEGDNYRLARTRDGLLLASDLRPRATAPGEPIGRRLSAGQTLLVHVKAEAVGTKGPTLSTYISIPGRYLVLMPPLGRVGVSKKIDDEHERRVLRDIMLELRPPKGVGFVVRTAGLVIDRARSEFAVKRGEARYRQIVEGAEDFAIVTMDAHGIITGWNSGAENVIGYSRDEAIGQSGELFYTDADKAAGVFEGEMGRARVGVVHRAERGGAQGLGTAHELRRDRGVREDPVARARPLRRRPLPCRRDAAHRPTSRQSPCRCWR